MADIIRWAITMHKTITKPPWQVHISNIQETYKTYTEGRNTCKVMTCTTKSNLIGATIEIWAAYRIK